MEMECVKADVSWFSQRTCGRKDRARGGAILSRQAPTPLSFLLLGTGASDGVRMAPGPLSSSADRRSVHVWPRSQHRGPTFGRVGGGEGGP